MVGRHGRALDLCVAAPGPFLHAELHLDGQAPGLGQNVVEEVLQLAGVEVVGLVAGLTAGAGAGVGRRGVDVGREPAGGAGAARGLAGLTPGIPGGLTPLPAAVVLTGRGSGAVSSGYVWSECGSRGLGAGGPKRIVMPRLVLVVDGRGGVGQV